MTQPKREVLRAYLDCANNEGVSSPGIRQIAWMTDYSERQVQRITHSLEDDGLLEGTLRWGKATEYRFDLSKGVTKPALGEGVTSVTPDIQVSPHEMSPLTFSVTPDAPSGDIQVSPPAPSHTGAGAVKQILKSQKTQVQEQGLKDKNFSLTPFSAPARPRFSTALYAGQDVYADAHFISPEDEFREFLTMCNAIFEAWLGALKTLKRAPMLSDETLWEQNREAAVSLAKFRADPAEVKAFVLAQYKAKDPFWRNLKSPMKLSAVANGLASWKVSPIEETVAGSANGSHDARAAPAANGKPMPASTSVGVNVEEIRRRVQEKKRLEQEGK